MTFTIVHITIAFVLGYFFGAVGMWLVQRFRLDRNDTTDHEQPIEPIYEDHLEDDQTRIQIRRNISIAPAEHSISPQTIGSIPPLIEEASEDTEDLNFDTVEELDVLENMTDELELEDVLATDDTLPFVKPKWDRPPN